MTYWRKTQQSFWVRCHSKIPCRFRCFVGLRSDDCDCHTHLFMLFLSFLPYLYIWMLSFLSCLNICFLVFTCSAASCCFIYCICMQFCCVWGIIMCVHRQIFVCIRVWDVFESLCWCLIFLFWLFCVSLLWFDIKPRLKAADMTNVYCVCRDKLSQVKPILCILIGQQVSILYFPEDKPICIIPLTALLAF